VLPDRKQNNVKRFKPTTFCGRNTNNVSQFKLGSFSCTTATFTDASFFRIYDVFRRYDVQTKYNENMELFESPRFTEARLKAQSLVCQPACVASSVVGQHTRVLSVHVGKTLVGFSQGFTSPTRRVRELGSRKMDEVAQQCIYARIRMGT